MLVSHKLSFLVLSVVLWGACGGSGATGQNEQEKDAPRAARAEPEVQDPTPAPAGPADLMPVLLSRMAEGDPVYVASDDKDDADTAIASVIRGLKAQGIDFKRPQWPNYQYYLNQLIPMARRSGRVWLIYDHTNEALDKTLREGFLEQQGVGFRQQFGPMTMALVTNEFAGAVSGRYALEPITGRSSTTTNICFTADGDYMFISSKEGYIQWFSRRDGKHGGALRLPRAGDGSGGLFVGGESGLIGMALHPGFAQNHKVYMHYNWRDAAGERAQVLGEWVMDMSQAPARMGLGSERRLLSVRQVKDNHNGGCLMFGPDGYLYIAIGDGEDGEWTNGRSPAGSMRGKVLRIDVDRRDEGKQYAVPADNPFVGDASFPPETWGWGFRNPWRIAFVPDGRLIASDIGEDVNEELTFVVKGSHHGWPYYEGSFERNKWTLDVPLQPPLVPYSRDYGMSVIAGNVYEGTALPELVGKFVFCDYLSGQIWAFELPDTGATLSIEQCEKVTRWPLLLPAIAKGPDGELYFASHTGEVLKLVRGAGDSVTSAPVQASKPDAAVVRSMFGDRFRGPAAPASTDAQRELGMALFADTRLSGDGARSCATCHPLASFGQDGRGAEGAGAPSRNTLSVFGAEQQFAMFWDYRVATVEQAVLASLASHMGNASAEAAVARVAEDPAVRAAFEGAGAPTAADIGLAIGSYLRGLVTTSRWDRYLDGDDGALSDAERIGLGEFLSAGCVTCHMYRGLGGGMPQKLGLVQAWQGPDLGRGLIDKTPGQEYFFKVPVLYNVAETGPWYHDGSMKTLADAVRNMAKVQLARELTDEQAASIATFLGSLTGSLPDGVR